MKRIKIILGLVFVVCINGCTKDNSGVGNDSGIHVKQYGTGTPIANAMVVITRGALGSGVGTAPVETLYTDNEGKTRYTGSIDRNYMYYAEAYKNNYFDTHDNQASVSSATNYSPTIYMYAYSYVKLHVKNVNPFDHFDWIDVQSQCNQYIFQGLSIDTTFIWCDECNCAWFGNFFYEAAIGYNKNQTDYVTHINFTPISFDTITVNINF